MSVLFSHFPILIVVLGCTLANANECLRNGCKLTSGLQMNEVNATIKRLLKEDEEFHNVLRVTSWNILQDKEEMSDNSWLNRRNDMCEYLNSLNPTIIGMQEVQKNQLDYLSLCMKGYSYNGAASNADDKALYCPIFYKPSKMLRMASSGTFWLSETPDVPGSKLEGATEPRIATWARLSFTQQYGENNEKNGASEKILRLLKIFTSKLNSKPRQRNIRRKYSTTTFYVVNTNLDWRDDGIAQQQVRILLSHLKNTIMDRRRYHVIMMGDLNWEDDSAMYEQIKRFRWIKNTMVDSRETLPALTTIDMETLFGEKLVDYIWQSKFDPILSATLMDLRPNARLYSDHRPVFAALKPV